jgi:hypothetical protein
MVEMFPLPTREHIVHVLDEAAEFEQNLMCAYLYAAFSLKDAGEGLTEDETGAAKRWRRAILDIAIAEMGHLAAVWNITSAIGGSPRFGRNNFPIDPGSLPAGIVVKLAPFSADVLQHFIYLERPAGSDEPEGKGFECASYKRGVAVPGVTPISFDYATIGEFYRTLETALTEMAAKVGEDALFCGDPALQLSPDEVGLREAHVVRCSKSAVEALAIIVTEGEGAPNATETSHFSRFKKIRDEYRALLARNPSFEPAHPAALNPVLRRPPGLSDRILIDDPETAPVVDLANAAYQTLVRLLGYSYMVQRPDPEKRLAVGLGIGLMKTVAFLAESAARRPAGPTHPGVNAGMSFTALRDAAPLPHSASTRRVLVERLKELSKRAGELDQLDSRIAGATGLLQSLAQRAEASLCPPGYKPVSAVDLLMNAPFDE